MKILQLSMYSISDLTTKKSIKLWRIIENKQVVVLIDCGASHNFISSKLVKEESLPIEETLIYYVEVGDGRNITYEGMCPKLKLLMQNMDIEHNFFIFRICGLINVVVV